MMRSPDGHGRLELTKFRNPKLVKIDPAIAPPNTLGLRSVMFAACSSDTPLIELGSRVAPPCWNTALPRNTALYLHNPRSLSCNFQRPSEAHCAQNYQI
jgi:hypothetical protein